MSRKVPSISFWWKWTVLTKQVYKKTSKQANCLPHPPGINPLEGVVMLASTNRVDILDQALLRPGRFDRQISIDLPTLPERKEIFEVYLKKVILERPAESYSSRLAALTPQHSGEAGV